jgi:hypothetical protein
MHRRAFRWVGTSLLLACALVPATLLSGREDAAPAPEQPVPYRLTETKHILVRARINGKGPYNFILDTGSPALFLGTNVARKLGLEAGKNGWATLNRFELEGGLVIDKAKARIDDPYQVEGMNKSGVAGVELHGIIGYNILARYRLTIDFTKDKLLWQRLDTEPPLPEIGGKVVDVLSGLGKIMDSGTKVEHRIGLRGYLGVTLAEKDGVVIDSVLDGSPAADAKLQVGDRITHIHAKAVKTIAEVHHLIAPWSAGDDVEMTIVRSGTKKSVRVQLGKGL